MVLAPLTTPAHFTSRRSAPPLKAQFSPPSPTELGVASPHTKLRAWRNNAGNEDKATSPKSVKRSIFSLNPKELAAMILEDPEKKPDESPQDEESSNPQVQMESPWEHLWSCIEQAGDLADDPNKERTLEALAQLEGVQFRQLNEEVGAEELKRASTEEEDRNKHHLRNLEIIAAIGGLLCFTWYAIIKPKYATC